MDGIEYTKPFVRAEAQEYPSTLCGNPPPQQGPRDGAMLAWSYLESWKAVLVCWMYLVGDYKHHNPYRGSKIAVEAARPHLTPSVFWNGLPCFGSQRVEPSAH